MIENYPFESNRFKGLYCDGVVALSKSIETNAEKACILAEELGHHYTTVGDIMDQSAAENRKQEQRARAIAYNKMIGLYGLLNSYLAGCRNRYEVADYLGITEEFFEEALEYYRSKYGTCAIVDNYMIFFEPLGVLELYK